jgi:hypothetical protein
MPKNSPKNSTRTSELGARTQVPATETQVSATPKTGTPSTAAQRVKSLIRNTFLASPAFPRLYADVVISSAPNSNEAKILARNYQKIIDRTNMPNDPSVKICTHIKVTGVRCGSPALRGEQFCYFHQRMLRTVKGPPDSRLHHVALLESEEAIQASLMEVVNALVRKTIDLPRAELVLRALNTAVRNARRVHFGIHTRDMVTRVPDFPEPPSSESVAQPAAALRANAPAVKTEASAPYPTHPKPPASARNVQVTK